MEKIIVNPLEVRGLGNIVSPKTLEDFEVYDAELSFEDGLYTLAYDASGVSVGLSVSSGSISVGESVVLTAEVLSAGEPASGETVSFYDGSTLLGTDETDSDGIATYTASSLGVGSHSLTAEALDESSTTVTVTVNKLTSTITLSVPSTGTVGTSYTVSGTLVPTSGSVKLYENSSLKDTLTVSSGSFSKAITQSNEGTYSYYAVFEGSSTYSSVTSSTGSIVVSDVPPVPVVTSVSLTGDKSILSYADSESATLSATVLDSNDDPMSGVTVEFFKGSTSLGTATTNSSGVATKSYASAGVGDVSFTASVGTISSETYELEDCLRFDDASSDNSSKYSSVNLNSLSWDTDHYVAYRSVTGSSSSTYYSQIYIEDTLPSDYEISMDIWASNVTEIQSGICVSDTHPQTYTGTNQAMVVYQGLQKGLLYRVNGSLSRWDNTPTIARETWFNFKLIVNGTSVTALITDTSNNEVYSTTQTLSSISSWHKWNIQLGNKAHYLHFKNFKIKPL